MRITILCLLFLRTMAPAQTFSTVTNFDGPNGTAPAYMSLAQGLDGSIYGTTEGGGGGGSNNYCAFSVYGCGTVFKITPGDTLSTLYAFCSAPPCTSGANPDGGVTLGIDGNFYGTTQGGGAFNSSCNFGCGTVFKIAANGTLTTLYSFCTGGDGGDGCVDGSSPYGGLVQATNGSFYGTTYSGGDNNGGSVFKITVDGALTTYDLCTGGNCTVGSGPAGSLIQASDGNLYGTTAGNGTGGTVYRMTENGVFTTLYSFCSQADCADGSAPVGGLVEGADKAFYGTTIYGGAPRCNYGLGTGCGTVFRITRDGTLTVLHSFQGPDGDLPRAGLIQANDGKLYGTTFGDGTNTDGTVFSITITGTLQTLHIFENTDGAGPWGGLLQATNGILYGTTFEGGSGGDCCGGTVFSLDVGLRPLVSFLRGAGKIGQKFGILGQGFSGATTVAMNGVQAKFNVISNTFMTATVPQGATTGYVTVTTSAQVLTSNVPFQVIH